MWGSEGVFRHQETWGPGVYGTHSLGLPYLQVSIYPLDITGSGLLRSLLALTFPKEYKHFAQGRFGKP